MPPTKPILKPSKPSLPPDTLITGLRTYACNTKFKIHIRLQYKIQNTHMPVIRNSKYTYACNTKFKIHMCLQYKIQNTNMHVIQNSKYT